VTKIDYINKRKCASFSLLETIVALGLLMTVVLEVSSVQGKAIYFSDYGRKMTQASWLAGRIMSQVEYYYGEFPLNEMKARENNVPIEGYDDFTYDIEIKEWKLPIINLITNATSGGGEEEEGGGQGDLLETALKQVLGDDPLLMTAHTSVCWPEGANRNCSELTYLLTNQKKFDDALTALAPVAKKLEDLEKPKPKNKNNNRPQKANPTGARGNPSGLPNPSDGASDE
jgi:hypothetical protein